MKKAMLWIGIVAIAVLLIDMAVMGLKIFTGGYEIMAEANIALVCWGVMIVWGIFRLYTRRCPHCGKPRLTDGKYCPYCGKEI